MKKTMSVFLAAGLILGFAGVLMAATGSQTYTVSTTVPSPSSVSITAVSITAGVNPVNTPVTGTALSLDPLTFDTVNQIYLSNHYFAISAGPAGGAGSTSVSLSYAEGANPNNVAGGSTFGLGWKTVGTFMKVVGSTETPLSGHGGSSGKKMLKDVTAETVTTAELGTGTFKLYVGIQTNPSALGEPAGSQVFSAVDKPGIYSGSLVVSATVV